MDAVVVWDAGLLLLLPSQPGRRFRAVATLRVPRLCVRRLFWYSVRRTTPALPSLGSPLTAAATISGTSGITMSATMVPLMMLPMVPISRRRVLSPDLMPY